MLLSLFIVASAWASVADLTKAQQCALQVKVYNRCEKYMEFSGNEVRFLATKKSVLCDDGRNLPFEQRLHDSDISSMLSQAYVTGKQPWPNTTLDLSPGGIRQQDFVKAVYGSTEAEVEHNVVPVEFLGQKLQFNKRNGAALALSLVNKDLLALYNSGADPKLNEFLRPFVTGQCRDPKHCHRRGGTFVWRVVASTNQPSNHSYAVAIDLEPSFGPEYWLWDVQDLIKEGKAKYRPGADPKLKNPRDVVEFAPASAKHAYPQSLVDVFEKHGFIWGGKWYRYDLMHFEFRPEFFPDKNFPCHE